MSNLKSTIFLDILQGMVGWHGMGGWRGGYLGVVPPTEGFKFEYRVAFPACNLASVCSEYLSLVGLDCRSLQALFNLVTVDASFVS